MKAQKIKLRRLRPLAALAVIAAATVAVSSAQSPPASLAGRLFSTRVARVAHGQATSCPGSPVTPTAGPQKTVEEVGLDTSALTMSRSLRGMYAVAALAVVDRASAEGAALQIVAFGASGVGASLLFQGSFAPTSVDDVYNEAAANRRCSRLRCPQWPGAQTRSRRPRPGAAVWFRWRPCLW